LKQCGHDAATFLTLASLSVSTFCWASIWNTNSLPSRRAGCPVQVFEGDRAVHPVQVLDVVVDGPVDDGDLEVELGDPIARRSSATPQGLARRSRLFSMAVASAGNADSTRTLWRRMPSMWSMCSMSTAAG
jgi:hypothetical protein